MKVEEVAGCAPILQRASGPGDCPDLSPKYPVRKRAVGAEIVPGKGADFRVWAPHSASVILELLPSAEAPAAAVEYVMHGEPGGYWRLFLPGVAPGSLYRFKLPSGSFPDPASRFQPQGPHGPSEIVDPHAFAWADPDWKGVPRHRQVIYEMHVGTFTSEGDWRSARLRLPDLRDFGITVIELMPVADFPGRFGWGYDGVNLFSPTRLYGRPDEFRAFVNQAHQLGLGVILDVVYNHFGPDGNYWAEFSRDYFSDRYKNEWGRPINFDGVNSAPVREFFLSNAAYWIEEFHLDGLRLDATQQVFDASSPHILEEITQAARYAAPGRSIFIIAENEPQNSRLLRLPADGGFGMDAVWNDDFHHSAKVALTGRTEAYYTDYRGTPQELISCVKRGFLFQGQWYAWQKKNRGTPTRGLHPEQFIAYLQNHDQVANSLRGLRIDKLAHPGDLRAMTALLLLGPATPLLFQGQEFAASTPFLYFADHSPELARQVAQGRREFLRQFPSIGTSQTNAYLAEPHLENTFAASKLDWTDRERHHELFQLHKDLLKLRRQDPVFSQPRPAAVDGAVLSPSALLLRFIATDDSDRLLLVNLGEDLALCPAPEPLLAPPERCAWKVVWCSEAPVYGGCGIPELRTDDRWGLTAHSATVLAAEPEPRALD